MYYVYVLQSQVTGRHYTGSTSDVPNRVWHHNSGATPSTRHGIPWLVIYTETYQTKSEAQRRERWLKTGRGRDELKTLLAKDASAVVGSTGGRGVAQSG